MSIQVLIPIGDPQTNVNCYAGKYGQFLRTKILDFGVFDPNRSFKGWNSHVHREFFGSVESTNLRCDNLSREIGRRSRPPRRGRNMQ